MARWTVTDDDQVLIVETMPDDRISLDIPARRPFIADRDTVADLRRKLALAIGASDAEQQP